MPDQNQTSISTAKPQPNTDDVIVSPTAPEEPTPKDSDTKTAEPLATVKTVADDIQRVHNILIALSSDPSVDEITAAIGLSLYLDRIGKRATSIYSGQTPNILEFLQPEKTFETNADVLRDFVIALDKNKADHLRYKLDGDYVKIFITPYKTRIDINDFDFSLGDFNIELVLALNVPSGIDLDDALREHGRVMHDATVINITNGNPGKFGDIEWNDKSKSSVSEMIAGLLYELGGSKEAIKPDEATALLAGIISATDHFSNNSTTADAMQISAQLINSGANRELISENIGLEAQNMFFRTAEHKSDDEISTTLDIDHDNPNPNTNSDEEIVADLNNNLPDLKAVVDDLAKAEAIAKPHAESDESSDAATHSTQITSQPTFTTPPTEQFAQPTTAIEDPNILVMPTVASLSTPDADANTTPDDFTTEPTPTSANDYGQMLEDALVETDSTPGTTHVTPDTHTTSTESTISAEPATYVAPAEPTAFTEPTIHTIPTEPTIPTVNPASSISPIVAAEPDINGVPIINYSAAPNDNVLPPPPAPPIDLNSPMPPASSANLSSPINQTPSYTDPYNP